MLLFIKKGRHYSINVKFRHKVDQVENRFSDGHPFRQWQTFASGCLTRIINVWAKNVASFIVVNSQLKWFMSMAMAHWEHIFLLSMVSCARQKLCPFAGFNGTTNFQKVFHNNIRQSYKFRAKRPTFFSLWHRKTFVMPFYSLEHNLSRTISVHLCWARTKTIFHEIFKPLVYAISVAQFFNSFANTKQCFFFEKKWPFLFRL